MRPAILALALLLAAGASRADDASEGLAAARRGEPALAVELLTRALDGGDLSPRNQAVAYNNRAMAWHQLGEPGRSLDDLARALALDPGYAVAYNNRGLVQARLGNAESAVADFSRAIELSPAFPEAHINRGNAYIRLGLPNMAVEDYTRALYLVPENAAGYRHRVNAYSGRAWAYCRIREYERCLEDIEVVLQFEPLDPRALHTRGLAHRALGALDLAARDFELAASLDPTNEILRADAEALAAWRAGTGLHETASAAVLRAGPGSEHASLGELPPGTAVEAVGRAGPWVEIRLADGDTAFVHDSTLRPPP